MTQLFSSPIRSILLATLCAALAACGGGGGGSSGSAQAAPPPSSSTNTPPTISGQPAATVLAGQSYTFTPSATDANGDALTFSVSNLPAWATFDASTGRVSGTPSASQIATYRNIVVSVSDGRASTSLAAFSITVTDSAMGSATLSWVPPTTNSDGTALTNLSGYEVRYGRSEVELTESITIDNPSLNVYVVENLSSGTWYFAVAAVNSAGVASELSSVGSKTIS